MLNEAHLTLEQWRRASHSQGGELGGKDAVAGGEGECAALPHREFSSAGESQSRAGRAGDSQRMESLLTIKPSQPGRGQGCRDRAVGRVVPTTATNAGRVAEPALDLVGDGGGRDPLGAGGLGRFSSGHHGGPVVTRVRRFEREVRIVAIEVADMHAVGERGPVRHGLTVADQCRRRVALNSRGEIASDSRCGFVNCADRTGDGVEQPPLGLDDHLGGKVLEPRIESERCQPISQRRTHRDSSTPQPQRCRRRGQAHYRAANWSLSPRCSSGQAMSGSCHRGSEGNNSGWGAVAVARAGAVRRAGSSRVALAVSLVMPMCSRRMRRTSRIASPSF